MDYVGVEDKDVACYLDSLHFTLKFRMSDEQQDH